MAPNETVRWRTDERGPYIRTWTGKVFHLKNPRPDEFCPVDVAHHLAGIFRYTGASRYTVAQHCVVSSLMAERFYADSDLPARMLVHDIAEAYYGDMSAPLKSLCGEYRCISFFANKAVEEWTGIKFTHDSVVKEIDDRMWLTESIRLFGSAATEDYTGPLTTFPQSEVYYGVEALDPAFTPWKCDVAEYRFKSRFRTLLPHVAWPELYPKE